MIKTGLINGSEEIFEEIEKKSNQPGYKDDASYVLLLIEKNLIERIKTIKLLLDKEQRESIGILTRSFTELYVSLAFILDRDTKKRAKSYLYDYKISILEKFKHLEEINPKYTDVPEEAIKLLWSEVPGVGTISEAIKEYRKLHTKCYDNPNNHAKKWYNLNGKKRRFKDLMIEVGLSEDLYWVVYGFGSMDTHGGGSLGSIKQSGDQFDFEGILPSDICEQVVINLFCKSADLLTKYFGCSKNAKVANSLKQMGTSCKGGNFPSLYRR